MSAFSSGSKIGRARQLSESRPAIPRPKSIGRHDLSPLDKPPSLRVSPDDGVAVLATAIEPAPLQLQSGARDLSTVSARHCPLRRVGQKFGREPLQPWDHPAVFDVRGSVLVEVVTTDHSDGLRISGVADQTASSACAMIGK